MPSRLQSLRNGRFVRPLLAALIASVLPATSFAAAPAETVGTVRELVAGDIACYLTYTDGEGRKVEVMADFAVCERPQELLGKRVRLRFGTARVQAASCQGNPDCKATEIVRLVTQATPLSSRVPR
jgi:hypothetical protein